MSSFFTVPAAQKKRKRAAAPEPPKKRAATSSSSKKQTSRTEVSRTPKSQRRKQTAAAAADDDEDSISSGSDSPSGAPHNLDDSDADAHSSPDASDSDADAAASTIDAAARRLRLAERYLERTRREVDAAGFDAADVDRDLLAERLETDLAEAAGRPQYRRASLQLDFAGAARTRFGGWTGGSGSGVSVTSVAVCAPHHAYTTATDGSLTKWRLQDLPRDQWPQTTRNKPKKPPAPPKRKPERVAWRKAENGDKKKGEKGEKGVRKGRKKGAPTPLTQPGHTGGGLLAVAASPDGRFVATGGADRRLVIWDAATLRPLKTFALHRGAVTGLAFRRGGSNQLFSASRDRSIKVWSAAELAYVETLYGHQDDVVDVAALGLERCVSVGARDRTARYWKVAEESQLVFRGGGGGSERRAPALPSTADPRSLAHEGSMDCVAMVDDELFVTGSDNGSLALWSIHKKKALFVLPRAHGLDPPLAPADVSSDAEADPTLVPPPQPRWITALAALPYTDTVLSGSWDGCVRVWRVGAGRRTLEPVGVLGSSKQTTGDGDGEDEAGKTPVATNGERGMVNPESRQPPILGIINDIAMFERGERPGQDGLCVVVGSGREIRLGRWKVMKGAKGGAFVFEVPRLAAQEPVTSGVGGAHEEAGGTRA